MPAKILEKRVAVAGASGQDLSLAALGTAKEGHAAHQLRAPRSWADRMEKVESIPPLFESFFGLWEEDDADG